MKHLVTGFVKITGAIPMWLLMKRKTYYANRKEQGRKIKGSGIIISNHKSMFDFPLMLCLFPLRRLHFLMAELLYNRSKVFSWFLNMIGGIKVDRVSRDLSFVSEAVELLNKGKIVGIFPEGKLSTNNELSSFSPSIVYIALKSGAPIIPIYCNGIYGFFKRTRVIIGEKIYLTDFTNNEVPDTKKLKELCLFLQSEILKLKLDMERQIEKD